MNSSEFRTAKTAALLSSFVTVGMGLTIVGPTLLDLSQQTRSSLTLVSACLTARSGGYVIGSVLSKSNLLLVCDRCNRIAVGIMYSRVNFQLTAVITQLLGAVCNMGVPFVTQITILIPVFVLTGVFQSIYETGGYMFAVQLWGKKSAPVMQGLVFAFGVGGLLAPMIVKPFLTQIEGAKSSASRPLAFRSPNLGLLRFGG